MLTAADCGSSLSSLRIYRDHASILTFEFKYQDGTSYATGGTTDEYDDLVFQPNECLVKIEQTMDMDQTDGDGSGHRRRAPRAPNALGRIAPGRGEPTPGSPRARLRLPTAPCVRHWDELGLLGSQQGWCWDEQIMSCWGWKASGWARGTGAWWSCSWAAAAWR